MLGFSPVSATPLSAIPIVASSGSSYARGVGAVSGDSTALGFPGEINFIAGVGSALCSGSVKGLSSPSAVGIVSASSSVAGRNDYLLATGRGHGNVSVRAFNATRISSGAAIGQCVVNGVSGVRVARGRSAASCLVFGRSAQSAVGTSISVSAVAAIPYQTGVGACVSPSSANGANGLIPVFGVADGGSSCFAKSWRIRVVEVDDEDRVFVLTAPDEPSVFTEL